MKKRIFSIVAIAALIALPMSVAAQQTAGNKETTLTATTAKATIVTPISLENTAAQALNFGTIASSSTNSGTVVLSPAETPTVTNSNVSLINSTRTAAKFTVTGQGKASYTITLPEGAAQLNGPTGSTPMTVNNWTCDLGTGTVISLSMPDEGTKDFFVGGTLNVGKSQTAGDYTGTFNVNVNYN